jgi:cytochrome P450
VSEALRLYPPGATTIREVPAAGASLQLGGFAVPAGSSVFVASYVMQRDPELWPRAGEFLPERWLPVRIQAFVGFRVLVLDALCVGVCL